MESRKRAAASAVGKMGSSTTGRKSHNSGLLTHSDPLDRMKVVDTSVDKVMIADIPFARVSSPSVATSRGCASTAVVCTAPSKDPIVPSTASAVAEGGGLSPPPRTRATRSSLVEADSPFAATRLSDHVAACPTTRFPAATHPDSLAPNVDALPTPWSPHCVANTGAVSLNGDTCLGDAPVSDSTPIACSFPPVECALADNDSASSTAVPSVTVTSSAVTTLSATADSLKCRSGKMQGAAEESAAQKISTVSLPPNDLDQVFVTAASRSGDAAVACPERTQSGETSTSPGSVWLKSDGHSSLSHHSSGEGAASVAVVADVGVASRGVGDAAAVEHTSVGEEDWRVEEECCEAAPKLPDDSPRSVGRSGEERWRTAASEAVADDAEDTPLTEAVSCIAAAVASASEKQTCSTAEDSSLGTVLPGSAGDFPPTAPRDMYSAAAQETVLSVPAAAEVGLPSGSTTPARIDEEHVWSSTVKRTMQAAPTHSLLEQRQQENSDWTRQQQERATSELQEGQNAVFSGICYQHACAGEKVQREGAFPTEQRRKDLAVQERQFDPGATLAHSKEAVSTGELRGEDDSSLLQQRSGAASLKRQQEHVQLQWQEEDALLPEQREESRPCPAQQGEDVSAQGEKQQEQHGLEALLYNPLTSLAELASSPSPLALSLTSSLGCSLLSKAETGQEQNAAFTEEKLPEEHHELQAPLRQQPPQQQLLSSAGDLLWKMGRRIGSGSRAAAEAAASAAAKAASAAAVATIGEPTVVAAVSKGSVENHGTSSAGEVWKHQGNDSSASQGFIWTAARGCISKACSSSIPSSSHTERSNGVDATNKLCSNSSSTGEDSNAVTSNNVSSTGVSKGAGTSSSSLLKCSSPRASPSESDALHSDASRRTIHEEELLHERDALREQVRIYQEALAQLLEPPTQQNPDLRDRSHQQKQQQDGAAAPVSGGRLSFPRIFAPLKENRRASGVAEQPSDSHRSSSSSTAVGPGAGAGRGHATAGEAFGFAACAGDAAATSPFMTDAVAASVSTPTGAIVADPSSVPACNDMGLSTAAVGADERGGRKGSDVGGDSSVLQDRSWCAGAAALEQLQEQLVELLCERAACAAATAATTAAEATLSTASETRRPLAPIDTAAVAAATSVALTDDEELLRHLRQHLKQASCSVSWSRKGVPSAHRRSCRDSDGSPATSPTNGVDTSLHHAQPRRGTRSDSGDYPRRLHRRSRKGRISAGNCGRPGKEGNVSDGSCSNRSGRNELRRSGRKRHFLLEAGEREQLLAKIQQQQLELEQHRDINERQTKQLMQLTLQLTSFKTEADNRSAAEQLERARQRPEQEESLASSGGEKQEELAAIDAQQQQLEELATAAAESFGLKCHLQELSKMYTKATDKEAALRHELEELRGQLTQQQQEVAKLQEQQRVASRIDALQDLRTDATQQKALENEMSNEEAISFQRVSPSGYVKQETHGCEYRSSAAADKEAIATTLMVDAAVQTTEVGDFLPPALAGRTRHGDSEALLTQEAPRCDKALLKACGTVSSEHVMQQKGVTERDAGGSAAAQENSVGAGAVLTYCGPSSYADAAAGARTCLASSLSPGAGEGIPAADTSARPVAPTDSAAATARGDVAALFLEGSQSDVRGNMCSTTWSREYYRRKRELDRDKVPGVKFQDELVTADNPSAVEKVSTVTASSERNDVDDEVSGFLQRKEDVEQARAVRRVQQRIQSLEFELESIRTQYYNERRRLQRHMLDLKTLCAKEKHRREQAEAECERLMAATLEQQAFVLQKTSQREGEICGDAEKELPLPSSSKVLPFSPRPLLQSRDIRAYPADKSLVAHMVELPVDCSSHDTGSFEHFNAVTTTRGHAAATPVAAQSAMASRRQDDHPQHEAVATSNEHVGAACGGSTSQWKSPRTNGEEGFLRQSENSREAGDARNVQDSKSALRTRTTRRNIPSAEVHYAEEGGLAAPPRKSRDALVEKRADSDSSSEPGLRELQKAYALAQEELERVQESQTLLQADAIRKAEIISFFLKKYALEEECFEAEDLSSLPHSFRWKSVNTASNPEVWGGATVAELQNLIEKTLAENIRLRSDLATLGFDSDRLLMQKRHLEQPAHIGADGPAAEILYFFTIIKRWRDVDVNNGHD